MTAARPSVAIVNTYFGSPPPWLPAFFRSCQTNADVQWLMYADFEVPTPPNVSIRRMDLREFSRRASEVVGTTIEIQPSLVRKICDFKPLYGLMFADDLRGFDWWAYSDIDVIWGDVRRFVRDELLQTQIVVSPRQRKLGVLQLAATLVGTDVAGQHQQLGVRRRAGLEGGMAFQVQV